MGIQDLFSRKRDEKPGLLDDDKPIRFVKESENCWRVEYLRDAGPEQ